MTLIAQVLQFEIEVDTTERLYFAEDSLYLLTVLTHKLWTAMGVPDQV